VCVNERTHILQHMYYYYQIIILFQTTLVSDYEKQRRFCSLPEKGYNPRQVSISPTFYWAAFSNKMFFETLMCIKFGFVIIWWKWTGAKAACKMLLKSTIEVGQRVLPLEGLLHHAQRGPHQARGPGKISRKLPGHLYT